MRVVTAVRTADGTEIVISFIHLSRCYEAHGRKVPTARFIVLTQALNLPVNKRPTPPLSDQKAIDFIKSGLDNLVIVLFLVKIVIKHRPTGPFAKGE